MKSLETFWFQGFFFTSMFDVNKNPLPQREGDSNCKPKTYLSGNVIMGKWSVISRS